MLTADEVVNAHFATGGMFRAGYDSTQVDDWLDTVASTLRAYQGDAGGTVQLLAEDVAQLQFPTTRGGSSYDFDQVDTFLDRVAETLAAHERSA